MISWPARALSLIGLLICAATPSWAQGGDQEGVGTQRLGRFRAGPLHFTPYFRINAITLDSNVYYDAENRVTDLHASGGPGLRVVIPIASWLRLDTNGLIDYQYYAKSTDLRRLAGNARGAVEIDTNFVFLGVARNYRREFDRPNSEVYGLVDRETWSTDIDLEIKKLERSRRLRAKTSLRASRYEVAEGQEYDGVDLAAASNRDVYLAGLELEYGLSSKTSLALAGEYEINEFLIDETRDVDVLRVYGGFRLSSETRLSGELLGGIEQMRPKNSPEVSKRTGPYVRARLAYRFGTKTSLEGTYNLGQGLSIYQVTEGYPSRRSANAGARLIRSLADRVDIWLLGSYHRYRTDDPVEVEGGSVETLVDEYWDGGLNIGYAFRDQIRIGLQALYRERGGRNVSDLGIDGLEIGMTVRYTPD